METIQSQETSYPDIKTSIRTYKQQRNGAKVTLLGAIHLAHDRHYYPTLQQIMDDRSQEGAVVHYECVRKASPQETQAVIDRGDATRIMRRIRQIKSVVSLPYQFMDGMGLVTQKDHIALRDHWENHDASVIDLAQRFNTTSLAAMSAIGRLAATAIKHAPSELRAAKMLEVLSSPPEATSKNFLLRHLRPTIVDYRNDYALNAYDELQQAQPGRDAVLFWGEGHGKGLGEGLEARGFTQIDEQSVTAFHGETFMAQFVSANA